jgi:predicted nucleic acid-binding protein
MGRGGGRAVQPTHYLSTERDRRGTVYKRAPTMFFKAQRLKVNCGVETTVLMHNKDDLGTYHLYTTEEEDLLVVLERFIQVVRDNNKKFEETGISEKQKCEQGVKRGECYVLRDMPFNASFKMRGDVAAKPEKYKKTYSKAIMSTKTTVREGVARQGVGDNEGVEWGEWGDLAEMSDCGEMRGMSVSRGSDGPAESGPTNSSEGRQNGKSKRQEQVQGPLAKEVTLYENQKSNKTQKLPVSMAYNCKDGQYDSSGQGLIVQGCATQEASRVKKRKKGNPNKNAQTLPLSNTTNASIHNGNVDEHDNAANAHVKVGYNVKNIITPYKIAVQVPMEVKPLDDDEMVMKMKLALSSKGPKKAIFIPNEFDKNAFFSRFVMT